MRGVEGADGSGGWRAHLIDRVRRDSLGARAKLRSISSRRGADRNRDLAASSVRNEDSMLLQGALQIFVGANIDFADAVALADAERAECALYTFDRKLAKLAGTKLLKVG